MDIILVEGMDGAGKTTFIDMLRANNSSYVCVHLTYFDVCAAPNAILRYTELFNKYADKCNTLILDRGWYSDIVYGNVLRNNPDVSYAELRAIEHAAVGYGNLSIFFLSTTVDTAWKRCKRRGEELIKDKQTLKSIAAAYAAEIQCAKKYSPARIYEVKT